MVEPTIIANYGEENLGKTESIKMLYEKLSKIDESEEPFYYKPEEHNGDLCGRVMINGIAVGVSSPGDPNSYQERWLKELIEDQKCRIIVAACRKSDGKERTSRTILDYATKHGYRIFWTSNARIYEYIDKRTPRKAPKGILNRFNEQWAEEMARMIEGWCYA